MRGLACLGEAIVKTTASLICLSDTHTGVIEPSITF
jgi:threonine dehydrogenase-like Zn-dependent dehydrogenase